MGRSRKKSKGGSKLAPARLVLTGVEFARAYDGLLRGKPEPVLIFALYRLVDGRSELVCRLLQRVPPPAHIPGSSAMEEVDIAKVRLPQRDTFALLVCALEEDSGKDVAGLYQALGDEAGIQVFGVDEVVPDPRSLAVAAREAQGKVAPSHVHLGGRDLRDSTGDKWVGAALAAFAFAKGNPDEFRFPFVSRDGRNDWVALTALRA